MPARCVPATLPPEPGDSADLVFAHSRADAAGAGSVEAGGAPYLLATLNGADEAIDRYPSSRSSRISYVPGLSGQMP